VSRFNYTPLQNSAAKLIEKFGAEYRFERQIDRDYDPETGKPVSRNFVYSKNAVVSDFTKMEVSQNTVQQGDIKLLAETEDYKIGDLVSVNCLSYRIIDISTIQGSQQVMAVYLHLRK
jgi:predicted transcriptional regulator